MIAGVVRHGGEEAARSELAGGAVEPAHEDAIADLHMLVLAPYAFGLARWSQMSWIPRPEAS